MFLSYTQEKYSGQKNFFKNISAWALLFLMKEEWMWKEADGRRGSMPLEEESVGDAAGELLGIMGDHDHCLVGALAESIDNLSYHLSFGLIQSMKGLVEYQEFGVLDESTCQEA